MRYSTALSANRRRAKLPPKFYFFRSEDFIFYLHFQESFRLHLRNLLDCKLCTIAIMADVDMANNPETGAGDSKPERLYVHLFLKLTQKKSILTKCNEKAP